jgi:adenylosuccinate synthase
VSDRAHLVLPSYRALDVARDKGRKRPIGTTGRGIGIAYSMKSDRDGIRLADLDWEEKLDALESDDRKWLETWRGELLALRVDMAREMWQLREGRVLMEGAQGAMLDIDSGTYPFVSSGLSCAAGAASGSGIGPRRIHKVLGVCKAYTTRVGNGPLPTEFDEASQSDLYRFVRETGREYGVTTGRPRRCGTLDLVALRYACRVNSLDGLVLTHLDVYDTLDSIDACVAYDLGTTTTTDFPAFIPALTGAKAQHKGFPGWKQPLGACRTWEELPPAARGYVEFIENFVETPVHILSVGCERTQTIVRTPVW